MFTYFSTNALDFYQLYWFLFGKYHHLCMMKLSGQCIGLLVVISDLLKKNPANSKIHQGIFLMTILCKYLNIWSLLVYINLLTRTHAITVDIWKKYTRQKNNIHKNKQEEIKPDHIWIPLVKCWCEHMYSVLPGMCVHSFLLSVNIYVVYQGWVYFKNFSHINSLSTRKVLLGTFI